MMLVVNMVQNEHPLSPNESKKWHNSWFKLNCEGTCILQMKPLRKYFACFV